MSTANKEAETELTFYTRVTRPEGLSQAASVEQHEQYEARLKNGLKVRTRCTQVQGQADVLEYTLKVPTEATAGVKGYMEHNVVVDRAFYDTFALSADSRIVKTRYYFPNNAIRLIRSDTKEELVIPDVGFEVDVFQTKEQTTDWVKVDVELDPILEHLSRRSDITAPIKWAVSLRLLPIGATGTIVSTTEDATQKTFIGDLWSRYFAQQLRE